MSSDVFGNTLIACVQTQRPRRGKSLRREIVLMLIIKAALLYGLWHLFFSEPQLKKMTEGMEPGRVAATLIASPKHSPEPNH